MALKGTQAFYNLIYPVGSIYMSVNSANPSTLFNGTTWEQLKDRFLLAAGDTYTAGSTGGEATHKLTINEMPSHQHKVRYVGGNANGVHGGQPGTSVNKAAAYNDLILAKEGGDKAHNNMPPYLVVYVWKRIS